jgi:hypothetical protein
LLLSAQGWSQRQPWDEITLHLNAESVDHNQARLANAFSVLTVPYYGDPGLKQPWAEITLHLNAESVDYNQARLANAFSVLTVPYYGDPGLKQPWAEICKRLRRSS